MSRAFVRDDDGGVGNEDLPDRLISEHANLVTANGLAAIEAEAAHFGEAYAAAQAVGDRVQLQKVARDLRYWTARRASADVQPAPKANGIVQFGSRVSFEREDGRRQTYAIVGEDEADPAKGSISYVSPLAQALLGKRIGDSVRAGTSDAEIIGIA